jgi:4-amino-4-deoxy-L-arabinose transferase-like glycosyltransferase
MAEKAAIDQSTPGGDQRNLGGSLRSHWQPALLGVLIVTQLAVNWSWLSTNVVMLGWDRPRHLIESLVYNDILERVTVPSLFEAWTHSGYYPPLYHLAMVTSYKVFGVSMDAAVSVNLVFLVVLLLAAYGIAARIGGRTTGLLSAFVTSTFPMIFGMSRYTYIEFALTAMVALGIWLLLLSEGFRNKRYSVLFGICAGVGLLTKWTYVLFVFPALGLVVWRAGLLRRVWSGMRTLRLDRRWIAISAGAGAVLTLLWYLPNLGLVGQLPLAHLLVPISWLLVSGSIYTARKANSAGWNLAASLSLCLAVAGSWYLPRIDFVSHTFLIAWGRPERQDWAFGYYLDHLVNEQMSLVYMVVLLLVSVGLVMLSWRSLRKGSPWQRSLRSDFLLLFLWVILPYVVFSFRPSSKHSRFIMPILPALAAVIGYGLSRVRLTRLRMATAALVVLVGGAQWLALSFDGLGWLRNAAVVGPVNTFAHMFQNQLPSFGDTDRGFWVVPDILRRVSDAGGTLGRPVELAMLVNTRQVHDEHFLYLIYTDFPNVRLRELAQNWTGRPAYPQLFEVDYVAVPSANPDHKLDPESLEVVDMLLERPPTLFQEAFELDAEYPLPDGNVIYLYRKGYPLPEGYAAKEYEALGAELEVALGDSGVLFLHPPEQVALLGRYYKGRSDLTLFRGIEASEESAVVGMVQEAVTGHRRVATVFEAGNSDEILPVVGQWLSEHYFPAVDVWYGPVRLTLYDLGPTGAEMEVSSSARLDFGGEITLLRHSSLPATIDAGEVLPLILVWQAESDVSADYKLFLHLVDAQGNLVAQRDSEPVGGWRPTSGWAAGEEIEDRQGVLTTSDLPAGEYELLLGLYGQDGQRLPVLDEEGQAAGDKISLGTITIVPTCLCEARESATESMKYEEPVDE